MYIYGGIGNVGRNHHYRREAGLPFWVFAIQRRGCYVLHHSNGTQVKHDFTDVLIVEPDTVYEIFGGKQPIYGLLWLYFTPPAHLLPLLKLPLAAPGVHLVSVLNRPLRKEIQKAALNVLNSFSSLFSRQEALAMNALERVLLMLQPLIGTRGADKIPHDERILKAAEKIRQNPGIRWKVEELAKMVNMSETNLAHRFKEEMGFSPMRYVDIQRIESAKSLLLNTNAMVSEIADQLGYANPFHFSHRFQKAMGISPRAFRNDPSKWQ